MIRKLVFLSFSIGPLFEAKEGSSAWVSSLLLSSFGHLKGFLHWGSSLLFSFQCWHMQRERETMVKAPPPSMIYQHCHGSMAAWFTSASFPTTVSSLTFPQDVILQSTEELTLGLLFSFQPLCFLGNLSPCLGYEWLWQGLSLWSSLHSDCD